MCRYLKATLVAVVAAVIAGSVMLETSSSDRPRSPAARADAILTSSAEIAGVSGLQDSLSTSGEWEEKCCGQGGPCTPVPPNILGASSCPTYYQSSGVASGCGQNQGAPCWLWSGSSLKDEACVEPPPGSIIVPQCRMDGGSYACRPYKTGSCDSYWIPFRGLYCQCELNSEDQWATGRKKCAAGSNPCSAIVPASAASGTGN